jgi:hypothetical protein
LALISPSGEGIDVLGGVFISYRRDDSSGFARGIYDRLAKRLGRKSVFFDVDNIELGEDFVDVLSERVGKCNALVAVIGASWCSSADTRNQRRLDHPHDFVRIEIEAALERGIRVIPVLVDGASMPRPEDLPDSLKKLARRQGIEVSHTHFDSDVKKLTRTLSLMLEELRQSEEAAALRLAELEAARQADAQRQANEAAETERVAGEDRERLADEERAREVADTERTAHEERQRQEAAEEARRRAAVQVARRAEEESRAREAAEAEHIAREEREKREATEAAEKAEQATRLAEAEAQREAAEKAERVRLSAESGAQRAEDERRAQKAAEAERAAREERERREAADLTAMAEQARRLAEAESARQAEQEGPTQEAAKAARAEAEKQEAARKAEVGRINKEGEAAKAADAARRLREERPRVAAAVDEPSSRAASLRAPVEPARPSGGKNKFVVIAAAVGAVVLLAAILISQMVPRRGIPPTTESTANMAILPTTTAVPAPPTSASTAERTSTPTAPTTSAPATPDTPTSIASNGEEFSGHYQGEIIYNLNKAHVMTNCGGTRFPTHFDMSRVGDQVNGSLSWGMAPGKFEGLLIQNQLHFRFTLPIGTGPGKGVLRLKGNGDMEGTWGAESSETDGGCLAMARAPQ